MISGHRLRVEIVQKPTVYAIFEQNTIVFVSKMEKSRFRDQNRDWKGRTKKMPTISSAFGGISPVRQEQYHPEAKTISPVRRWPYHSNGED